jgi:ABC-type phosphate transport system permease subunit
MPSLLKLAVLCVFTAVGDLIALVAPFVAAVSPVIGTSIEKLSREGTGNPRVDAVAVTVADRGESPVEDGDILACSRTCVEVVAVTGVAQRCSGTEEPSNLNSFCCSFTAVVEAVFNRRPDLKATASAHRLYRK